MSDEIIGHLLTYIPPQEEQEIEGQTGSSASAKLCAAITNLVPVTVDEALFQNEFLEWKTVIESELVLLREFVTRKVVPRPKGKKPMSKSSFSQGS